MTKLLISSIKSFCLINNDLKLKPATSKPCSSGRIDTDRQIDKLVYELYHLDGRRNQNCGGWDIDESLIGQWQPERQGLHLHGPLREVEKEFVKRKISERKSSSLGNEADPGLHGLPGNARTGKMRVRR